MYNNEQTVEDTQVTATEKYKRFMVFLHFHVSNVIIIHTAIIGLIDTEKD